LRFGRVDPRLPGDKCGGLPRGRLEFDDPTQRP
jgi:hypothetical protein